MPSISVVIPTYNRGSEIKPTLDSVLAQTLAPREIIVVDDGSTDNTSDWIEQHYGDRVRLIRQPNGGVAKARNAGLEAALGEFIAYLDHDDLWSPEKLRLQLDAAEGREEVGVVYCSWTHFDKNGILPVEDPHVWQPRFEFGNKTLLESLLLGNFIISMSVPLIRTSLLREIGGFDPNVVPCDDWDIWIRLANQSEFVGIREQLVAYHQHENQQSGNVDVMWSADGRVRWKNWRIIMRHFRTIPSLCIPLFFKATRNSYAAVKAALFEKQWGRAWKEAFRCLIFHPFALLTPQWSYLMVRLIKRDSRRY